MAGGSGQRAYTHAYKRRFVRHLVWHCTESAALGERRAPEGPSPAALDLCPLSKLRLCMFICCNYDPASACVSDTEDATAHDAWKQAPPLCLHAATPPAGALCVPPAFVYRHADPPV